MKLLCKKQERSVNRPGLLTLLPLGSLLLLLLLASPAFAVPAVDGWHLTSLSDQASGSRSHARLGDVWVVWVEGNTNVGTKIVLYDIATGDRQTIATDGIEPEIEGDHVAYLGAAPAGSTGLLGGDVFVHTISTGENRQLTADAQANTKNYLSIHGDKVLWVSAAQVGIEGPEAGDAGLLMHDLSRHETVTLASGDPGWAGPGLYVASSEWVAWNYYYYGPVSVERPSQVWVYSMSTGETRELVPLAGYQVLALAGDTLVVSRTWSTYGGVEQFFTYDLSSGELRPFDKESTRLESVQGDGDLIAWAGYGNGSSYVALYDVRTGALTRFPSPGYNVGGLVLRGDLLIWHAQFTGRWVGTAMNYLCVYDRSRKTITRLATLFGSNNDYDTDGEYVAFTSGNGWWPSPWSEPLELLLASPVDSPVEAFLDVPGTHPYRTAIQGLKERGIVGGYPSAAGSEFRPDATLTRGQFAKMLALTLDIPVDPDAVAPFEDVEPGLYPGAYVAALASRGIAKGTTPKTFSPYATLTQAQLMTLLVRGLDTVKPGALGDHPTTNWPPNYQGALGPFDPTHGPNMLRAELNGLVDGLIGYGRGWDPWRPATRAEAAQALWNFLAKGGVLMPTTNGG
jgi:hypothetical protein